MAQQVQEIMNRELFAVRPTEQIDNVLGYLVALGITGAPVVDAQGKPLGFVSLRDLLGAGVSDRVDTRMSAPVDTIAATASIEAAADLLCERGRHHLIVVSEGRAIGFVGALDVVRGLRGRPVAHPPAFPHHDRATGLVWSDDMQLDRHHLEDAPAGPGLFVLVAGGAGKADRVVWSEAANDVRARLMELIGVPQTRPPHLADSLDGGELWFRAARAPSSRALNAVVSPTPTSA